VADSSTVEVGGGVDDSVDVEGGLVVVLDGAADAVEVAVPAGVEHEPASTDAARIRAATTDERTSAR
jgi:hypothetical protein